MDQNELFGVALGLPTPWQVIRSGLEESGSEGRLLYVDIDFKEGASLRVRIAASCVGWYDSTVKRRRHLNFWQHATYLSARVHR